MRKNKMITTWLLLFSMLLSVFSTGSVQAAAAGSNTIQGGYVTVSVEKFTLGQGYYKEPVKVPFYAGENSAAVLARALGEGNYRHGGSITSGFYLSHVKDVTSSVYSSVYAIPPYILNQMSSDGVTIGPKNEQNWLGEYDYTPKSGWMSAVNNLFPNVGMSDYFPKDGDVIRTQFTVYGWGADLGGSFGYIQTANKDALTAEVAGINSDPNKAKILADRAVKSEYDHAYAVLANMESTQESVDSSLARLKQSLVPAAPNTNTPKEQLDKTLAYLLKTVDKPTFGVGGGEWSVLSLARANYPVPPNYYQDYYTKVVAEVDRLMIKNKGILDRNKSTEHSRAILALTSIGKDPRNVGGYDLTKALANSDYLKRQGLNGTIFALIALDTRNYAIPPVEEGKVQSTRESLIEHVLKSEVNGGTEQAGGWALSGTKIADIDITAMTIQSLAPYYQNNEKVKAAVDRALNWLSQVQSSDGNYVYYGVANAESAAQVVTALSALGTDPDSDPRFVKNGVSVLDSLMSFALPDGGFMHLKPASGPGKVDGMATDQGTYALVAYDRFVNKKNRLYDMTDVTEETPSVPDAVVFPLPSGDQPKLVIPSDNRKYMIPVSTADAAKDITIEIASDNRSELLMSLPKGSSLPNIAAVKGNVSVVIPKGAQITGGDSSALELLTGIEVASPTLKDQVTSVVPSGKKLDSVNQAITIGGSGRVEFNQFITLTFAGMKGKEAAYIQNGVPTAIQKFSSDEAGKSSDKKEYAYDSGNDLIVKTKHFTDFVAFSSSVAGTTPGGNGGNPQPTKYMKLSIDKLTINRGYVIPESSVELKPGDTVWTLLKRELDNRGISYEHEWFEKYGSVYVQSIAGDGEFDHGTGSGWMYNVNGTYPNYGASKYILQEGDKVQWRYTTNLGKDLGQDNSQWEKPVTPTPTGPAGAGGAPSSDKHPVIEVPATINQDYVVTITKEQKNTDSITIKIPDVKHKVILNLEHVLDSIPTIHVVKGDITVTIDKSTVLKSGDPKIELLTAMSTSDTNLQKLVQGSLGSDSDSQVKLEHVFAMGHADQSVLFDKPLTFVIKGAKGQLLGSIEGGAFTPIQIYESESAGMEATKGKEKITYAFVKDNDLIVKTNHFTTFVSYTTGQTDTNQTLDLEKLYADASQISSWAAEAIREASHKNFVSGSDGAFHPLDQITRAEFTKMLVGVLGLSINADQASSSFKDVQPSDWFYPYVNVAYKAGFVTGYSDDLFQPNEKLTREQMAVIMVRALGVSAAGQASAIEDLESVSDWAKADVQTIVALELMTGWDNRFQPSDSVTREMAAVVAMRAYHYNQNPKKETKQPEQPDQPILDKKDAVKKQINETAAFLQQSVTDPTIGTLGGDWTVLGLARSGVPVPDTYYANYYGNVEKVLKEKSGKLHAIKYTEYDRVILGLTSIGKSVEQVAGYNLLEKLADFDTLIKQGINGPIFALIALDTKGYEIPVVQGVKTQTTREMLIDFILNREITGGGWALGEKPDQPDPDITAMAIQGLTPYYKTNKKVQDAVDRALVWLSQAQTADGGYASWNSTNSESAAQVVVALAGLGINPHTDARFIKNGQSALDSLLSFATESGGFYHVKPGGVDNGGAKPGEVDPMASDQAMYALVAYDRLLNGQPRLYDMTDVK